jgi:ribosomal protein S18 acetylase RimI-like enzyme
MFGSSWAKEHSFDEAEWRRRAARPVTFLASRDSADVGMAGVYNSDEGWFIMGMWLDPGVRGTGVVEALIGACEAAVMESGATRIGLWVMEDNGRGRGAYVRLGYQFTGQRQLAREGRDELLMLKSLPSSAPSRSV